MSERRHPTDHRPEHDAEREDKTAFSASLRAALVEWERSFVPALPSDFAERVMVEVAAHERAAAWESAFVPSLPEDFASTVAAAAMASEHNHTLVDAWAESLPALPEDFAQLVTDAALKDEAAREESARVAMREWAEAKVPPLPEDFARSVADAALRADDSPRASGVVEKVVQLTPKGAPKRRWLAPAAFSSIAAAAVAVLALTAGPKPHTQPNGQHGPNGQHTTPNHAQSTTTNSTQQSATGAGNGNNNGSNSAATTNNGAVATPEDGSEVEKVEVDGDRASFTAFSIAGEDDHGAVAVVWIEDGTKTSSAQ